MITAAIGHFHPSGGIALGAGLPFFTGVSDSMIQSLFYVITVFFFSASIVQAGEKIVAGGFVRS